MIAAPAVAAPGKLKGVQAWTNVSQTYIRVRPDQSTPIVAKVATHTPLYVWGKYQGWYRVQTQDDIFGWVHYKLLNSEKLGAVKELSPAAVERGARRSADTTMWGTPDQLKEYYAKYGAKGAAKGLIEMGVPVTIGGTKAKAIQAVTAPPVTASRQVAAPPAAKARVVTSSLATKIPVNSAPVVAQVAPIVAPTYDTQVITAPRPLPAQSPIRALAPAPPKTIARTAKPAAKAPAKRPDCQRAQARCAT